MLAYCGIARRYVEMGRRAGGCITSKPFVPVLDGIKTFCGATL